MEPHPAPTRSPRRKRKATRRPRSPRASAKETTTREFSAAGDAHGAGADAHGSAAPSSSPVAAAETIAPRGTSPVDGSELARIAASIRSTGDRVAADAGAADRAAGEVEQDVLDGVERLVTGDGAQLENLTEDEIADLFALGFGMMADYRGKHWELHDKSARRLGKWFKRVLDRHGWAFVAKWLPDVMAVLILGYEVTKRWKVDKEIAETKRTAEVARGEAH